MLGKQDLYQLIDATAYDREGDELGTVDTVFVDNETDEGTFALIKTGLFGSRSSFVPLVDANFRDGELHLDHTASEVKDAPSLDVDEQLTPQQELELYRYYGIAAVADDTAGTPASVADGATQAPETARTTGATPTGADLIADQGIDPTIDGPQTSAADRMRLRRLGRPASNAEDALLEHGDERA